MKRNIKIVLFLLPLASCNYNAELADAYGNFEADETVISAETAGKLLYLNVQEGTEIPSGLDVALVDTTQLFLKKEQLKAGINAIISKVQPVQSQINVLIEKRRNIAREKNRIEKLLADSAATRQQWDDISGQLELVDREMTATRERLESANKGILSEIKSLEVQIAQINDQIVKSLVLNPAQGTVLQKFAEPGEVTAFGMPLYKVALLSQLYLRAYISGNQLATLSMGQVVSVGVDDGEGGIKNYPGRITWISSKAEFTPKVIQTREERVNLVYAIKILVENDGLLKIGMPGEVYFN
ncbi:MAG TPA: HlyD family efflux transporter periplasmic adaptor subunit [Cyclobacteriaceae bacterium]|jgi:HlyD family secretion protein